MDYLIDRYSDYIELKKSLIPIDDNIDCNIDHQDRIARISKKTQGSNVKAQRKKQKLATEAYGIGSSCLGERI